MPTTMEGGCHCGRVRFRVTAELDRVSECNCSICTKKGILHLVVPPDQFQLVRGKDDLTTYQFNTKTASCSASTRASPARPMVQVQPQSAAGAGVTVPEV